MKKYKNLLSLFGPLNLAAIAMYFYFFSLTGGFSEGLMFSTVDSRTYLAVAEWINRDVATNALEFRPILYPLLLAILLKLGGSYAIFIFQSLLWLFTVNLASYSLLKSTKKAFWGFFGGVVIMSNVTFIALTEHALTEVVTTFLLAALVAFSIKFQYKYKKLFFIHSCLFILGLLTIIKPVFLIPLCFLLLFLVFHAAKYFKAPVNLIWLILVLMPLLIQTTIIKSEYGKFGISTVGSLAFQEYLFPEGVQQTKYVSREEALKISSSLSKSQKLQYVRNNQKIYFNLFLENIHDNVKASAPFLNEKSESSINFFQKFMVSMNRLYYKLHLIFIPITVVMLVFFLKHKEWPVFFVVLGLVLLQLYLILVTGISFWQGDRLVLPTIAIWSFLYPYMSYWVLKMFCNHFDLINWNGKDDFN